MSAVRLLAPDLEAEPMVAAVTDLANGQDHILTVEQLADMLIVPPYTVRQWAREGRLPALRLGKYWRFRESSIRQWLADEEKPPGRRR